MKNSNPAVKESLTAQSSDHIAASGKVIAEPVKQEPVAWMWVCVDVESRSIETGLLFNRGADDENTDWTPLYAAPVSAKREWVDLTDDEEYELAKQSEGKSRHWLVGSAIAAFKEKNK